ncbi:MAG: hypothetical protein AAGA48_11050 [Myxococcota bacterium]
MIPLLVFGLGTGLATEPVPSLDTRLRELTAEPVTQLLTDTSTKRGFRIIALSNAAEACARRAETGQWSLDEAREALARLASAAIHPKLSPFASPDGPFGDHNLYVTHWLIVLTALARVDPLHTEVQRGPALAHHLAERSLAHKSGVAQSFPVGKARWPADQAATLYALHQADRLFGLSLTDQPRKRYLAAVGARSSTVPGLPVSEWTGVRAFHDEPRGTAVAWSVRYLAPVDASLARSWWTKGKATFQSEGLGMIGFREWHIDREHPPDDDSGPIVMGLSVAATAFALGASRAMDDCSTHRALAHTRGVVESLAQDPEAAKAFQGTAMLLKVQQSTLAIAIAANQTTVPTSCPAPVPPTPGG